ncbi:hypothetical protein [Streptosporangium sp. KLBMP 9127]|nr:hypothetical protein [Streptosporangium sp. KLBMP 9127]
MTGLIRSLAVAATSVSVLAATATQYTAHAATGSRVDCVVSDPAAYNGKAWTAYAPNVDDKVHGLVKFYEYSEIFSVTDVFTSDEHVIYGRVQYCYDGAWRPYGGNNGWYNAGYWGDWDLKEGRRMKIQVCRSKVGVADAECFGWKNVIA